MRHNVFITNKQKDMPLSATSVKDVVAAVLFFESIETDELSIHFVGSKRLSALHEEFFQDSSPTDCITFPIDPPHQYCCPHILGEIFISPRAALEYASQKKKDPYHELTLYVVHGILHLLGYDDIDPIERRKMRTRERTHMKRLLKANLIIY